LLSGFSVFPYEPGCFLVWYGSGGVAELAGRFGDFPEDSPFYFFLEGFPDYWTGLDAVFVE